MERKGVFSDMKNISFRAHFQENLSSPFRTSNFFFFHFLLYCKRKEYICLIHEKSFIKITTMNIEPHNLIDPLREKLPHLIRHEKQYRMIHRQLMKKWFQYFVLFFIIAVRGITKKLDRIKANGPLVCPENLGTYLHGLVIVSVPFLTVLALALLIVILLVHLMLTGARLTRRD